MPSKSKAQQRFMGMVHALNKGEMKPSDASPAVKKAAKSMDTKSTEKYASTKHKGKPEKVNKEWIVKTIKELTNTEMESCGYTTSAVDPNYKLKSPGGTGKVDKKLKELAEKMGGCLCEKCWKGYKIHPTRKTKELFGKKYPNCVKAESINEAYGLSEMKMSEIDKLIKSKIKDVARKDRKRGMELMNLYKKHWIEFMLKTKDLLSTETLGVSLVNPKGMKKQTKDLGESILTENPFIAAAVTTALQQQSVTNPKTKNRVKLSTAVKSKDPKVSKPAKAKAKGIIQRIKDKFKKKDSKPTPKKQSKSDVAFYKRQFTGESILNEMDYRGFVKYMNDFYGPKGIYPDKKKRTLKMKDIGMAYSVLLKKKPDFEIGYDSTDREMLRDILIKLRKLDPDYSKKESVKEGKGVDKIMKMANDNSFGKLAGRTVDGMSANLFKQVYDKAPQNAKDKIDKMNEKQLYVFMGKLWSKFGRQVRL